MKIKELQKRPKKELKYLLENSRKKLMDLRFKVSSRQLKNVREIRKTKKLIAQILTLLKNN